VDISGASFATVGTVLTYAYLMLKQGNPAITDHPASAGNWFQIQTPG